MILQRADERAGAWKDAGRHQVAIAARSDPIWQVPFPSLQQPLDNMSNAAKLAYKSLRDHPHLTTPEAIANGPYSIDQLNAGDIADGLRELEVGGRAAETFGGWSILR